MLKQQPQAATRAKSILGTVILASTVVTSGVVAHDYGHALPDPVSYEFRAEHPFRVFVDLTKGHDRRSGARANASDHFVQDKLRYLLPDNIVVVSKRRDADMIVRAHLTDYDLSFHVTDVDRRNKKYKKKRRYLPGRCGHHQRAYYTRVTEKGIAHAAHADYHLSFKLRGEGTYGDNIRIRSAESYRYGENLQALTNCGVAPSAHFPNSTVARLFSQAGGHYRDVLAKEIQTENLSKLSYVVAGKIKARADQFYVSLAAAHRGHDPYYKEGAAQPGIYDYDHVNKEPRYRTNSRRVEFDW